MNYNNKKFKVLENDEAGELDEATVFHYKQEGNILSCSYSSRNVLLGHLIGIVDEQGNIDMRYHQINQKGELKTGECYSSPSVLANGKIVLNEKWKWTSPEQQEGYSKLIEL